MKQLDVWMERNFKKMLTVLLVGAAAMYVIFALDPTAWADEAYSFALVRHSYAEIWTITGADSHPPLFYFYLKTMIAPFGYDLLVARLAAALPCLAVIAIGGIQFKKLFGTRTAVLFMVLYIMFPFLMDYTVEVRMYSIAEMFILLNAVYAYRCWMWDRKKDWAIFALSGICAAYSHYFALVSAGIIYGLLLLLALWKKRSLLKHWLLASLATIVLYLPWLSSFIYQLAYKANNVYWIAPITLRTIVDYVLTIFSTSAMQTYPLFLGLAYLTALVVLLASRDKSHISVCLCALAVPLATIAVGVVASLLVRPVFVIRYVVPALPLVVFFFAFVLGHMSSEMLLSALLTVSIMGGISNAAATAKYAILPAADRLTAARMEQLPDCDAYVVDSGNSLHASQELCYFDPETPVYSTELLGPDNPYPNRVDLADFSPEEHGRIILVLHENEPVPEEYLAHYSPQYLCTVNISGTYESLWYLEQ